MGPQTVSFTARRFVAAGTEQNSFSARVRADCDQIAGGTENIPYVIEDGVAKLADRSAFAGSIATSDVLVRTCVQRADIPLVEAVRMITEVPARIMGLTQKGRLQENCDADIVIFDKNVEIKQVIVGGLLTKCS